MPKYGKKAGEKVEKVMHEMHEGSLKSGSGAKVTDPKQAIAIGLSEAREAGGKVPTKKSPVKKSSSAGNKKATSKKSGGSEKTKKSAAPKKKSATTSKSASEKNTAAPKKSVAKKAAKSGVTSKKD